LFIIVNVSVQKSQSRRSGKEVEGAVEEGDKEYGT